MMKLLLTNLIQSHLVRLGLLIPTLTLFVAACMPITAFTPVPNSQETKTLTNPITSTRTTTDTPGLPDEVMGVVWQWQDAAITEPSKYTLQFMANGRLLVQADCNRGPGAYKLVGKRLFIENIAMTRMACPPGSLDHTFLEQMGSADGYRIEGKNLILTIQISPGTMTFSAAPTTSGLPFNGVLTGTVTYRQRISLPAGSMISVQLQDVSKQDVAATVIATQTITTTGENVPIPFTLTYDPAQIDVKAIYALSVRITTNGQLAWLNTDRYVVLTYGARQSGIEVVVQSAK